MIERDNFHVTMENMKKVIIITGGSRGIGAATALLAAKQGYDICISYINDDKAAQKVLTDCHALGRKAIAIKGDIADENDVVRLFNKCKQALGPVTHLVNNAGIIGKTMRMEELDPDTARRVFNVNVIGAMTCSREAIRQMTNGGVIINLSSIAATLGSPGEYIHYAASKAAIEAMTIGLSKEVGPLGIRVNAIQAGTVDTDMHSIGGGSPERPAMVAKTAPLGRAGSVDDIAESILWLMDDRSSYTTGAILRVGGGL